MNQSKGKWDVAGSLHYGVFETRQQMGEAAATHVINYLKDCLTNQDSVRVVFGCAPSQDEFLASLIGQSQADGFDWGKVEIFHMDEYVGIKAEQPQSFRHYLHTHLLNHITPKAFHPLDGDAEDLSALTRAYQEKLASAPIDLICMGIGENGHVAFNDPPVADFQDPLLVKMISLDRICRQQQVNDGCFPTLADVPLNALTVTVPNFIHARALSCVVPNQRKAEAVRRTIEDPVGEACPSTMLRQHLNVRMFLDLDSASLLQETSSSST